MLDFCKYKQFLDLNIIEEVIKYDYIYKHRSPNIPKFLDRREVIFIQKNKHHILKDERILKEYLPDYKDMATKRIINKIHIEKFDIDIINLIGNDYFVGERILRDSYILFDYKSGVINRCLSYDITDYILRSDMN